MNSFSGFEHYADLLRGISDQNLAPQEGTTAEDVRAVVRHGEIAARSIAESNRVKSASYEAARRGVVELRSSLRNLAANGNAAIDAVNRSEALVPVKLSRIEEIISSIRSLAAVKASSQAGEIYHLIQNVLNIQGIDQSARAFATDHRLGIAAVSPWEAEELKVEISNKLERLNTGGQTVTSGSAPADHSPLRPSPGVHNSAPPPKLPAAHPTSLTDHSTGRPSLATDNSEARPSPSADNSASPANRLPNDTANPSPLPTEVTSSRPSPAPANSTPADNALTRPGAAPTMAATEVANAPTPAAPAPSVSPSIEAPAPSAAPSIGNPTAPQTTALSPNDLVENFNAGNQTGAPVSASAEAITTAAASPVHAAPPPLNTPLTDTSAPAPRLFETAHTIAGPTAEVTQLGTPPTEAAQPVAAPAPATAITPAIAAPPVSPGPVAMPAPTPPSSLMAYGADLRPPITATPVAPPMPPSATPGSAPFNPAGGSASAGQHAVVRQQPTAPTAQAGIAGLTERAFAATATGAAAGALTARAAAESRLQRLLSAVAHQQPTLRWAIGDLEDGRTILVTDLSGGWIPPHIDIPVGVELLPPTHRRSDLATLLGPTRLSAVYQPGQSLPPANDVEPVPTSIRARDTGRVDDLGWELTQATKWRDGLPRLAHTLAKAVSARTGCLDSEVELLRDHLSTVARTVIARYPRSIDPAQVGNWQLLATIDALINDERTLANYHFAWFRAHALTREANR